jgi:hypothetical protein
MLIENKFEIGSLVFLKTDEEQKERFITGIKVRPNGISYYVSLGENETIHYEFEITDEKDIIKATSN